jgi:thioredoxin-related protein
MKVLSLFLFVFLLVFVRASEWYPDFRKAVEVANREDKLILLYFYEEGCTYCKYMEEVVFIDGKVSTLMEEVFVVVPINVEDIPEELDRRFRAVGTPTFMVYDPKRDKLFAQIFGLQEAEEFFELLKGACRKAKRC